MTWENMQALEVPLGGAHATPPHPCEQNTRRAASWLKSAVKYIMLHRAPHFY
jgi:hypothetical protein